MTSVREVLPGVFMLPRLIVVDRSTFKLRCFRWSPRTGTYVLRDRFDVTVGKLGSRTPHGLYFVKGKSKTPAWRIPPDEDYAPETWGQIIPFSDPDNPFEGGFIDLHGKESGIGIHGTRFDPKVGTASSHGCIRMRTEDLLKVYHRVTYGTPVYIH